MAELFKICDDLFHDGVVAVVGSAGRIGSV
jgi:hypothetical protein